MRLFEKLFCCGVIRPHSSIRDGIHFVCCFLRWCTAFSFLVLFGGSVLASDMTWPMSMSYD